MNISLTVGAMNKRCPTLKRHRQRAVTTHSHRNVCSPCNFQQPERIQGTGFRRRISEYGCQPHHIQFWRIQRVKKRHRIINSRIGINDNFSSHRIDPTPQTEPGSTRYESPAHDAVHNAAPVEAGCRSFRSDGWQTVNPCNKNGC